MSVSLLSAYITNDHIIDILTHNTIIMSSHLNASQTPMSSYLNALQTPMSSQTISLPRENRLSRAKSWLRNSMSAELNHSQRYAVTVVGGGGSGVRGRSVTSSLKYHLSKDGHYRTTSTDGSCNSDISGSFYPPHPEDMTSWISCLIIIMFIY